MTASVVRPRSEPLISALESDRQYLIWNTIYDLQYLQTPYAGELSSFEIEKIRELVKAVCCEHLSFDPIVLFKLYKTKRQLYEFISINYEKLGELTDFSAPFKNLSTADNVDRLISYAFTLIAGDSLNKTSSGSASDAPFTVEMYSVPVKRLKKTKYASTVDSTDSRSSSELDVNIRLSVPLKRIDTVPVFDFETFAFNNQTKYDYYENTLFSTYFYQNAINYLNARTDAELDSDNRWQARLASIIKRTGFSECVATDAFYKSRVVFRGVNYDTSYVPNFPVRSLIKLKTTEPEFPKEFTETLCVNKQCSKMTTTNKRVCNEKTVTVSDAKLFQYWKLVNISTTNTVPSEYLRIFETFPFKSGHVVDKRTGKVLFLNLKFKEYKKSVVESLKAVYRAEHFETSVYECSKCLDPDDVLHVAAYSIELDMQGIALIVLRAMFGDQILVAKTVTVDLPYANAVVRWLKDYCTQHECVSFIGGGAVNRSRQPQSVLFPLEPINTVATSSAIDYYENLIKRVASTCLSEFDCAIQCSNYTLLPCLFNSIHRRLVTVAERYVFLTIAIQDSNREELRAYRKTLVPVPWTVPASSCDTSATVTAAETARHGQNLRNSAVDETFSNNRTGLVRPVDYMFGNTVHVKPKDLWSYEFINPQLREIVDTGYTALTEHQLLRYVAHKMYSRVQSTKPSKCAQ